MREGGVAGFVSENPGRDVQRVGTARFLGQDPSKIYDQVWGVVGNLGDSQCYLGVRDKVDAIHAALGDRIARDRLSGLRQLRRDVHVQHDAIVHRRAGLGAAGHGGPAVRRRPSN
jgi:hypothetical protein